MRIAVFIKSTTFHKGYGGLETQNQALCEGFAKRGHEVVVFTPKRELDFEEKELNGVYYVFISCSFRSLYGFSHLDKNNWFNKSASYFANSHNEKPFDIVIGQSSAALGIIGNKDRFGVKIISISHGTAIGEYKTVFSSIDSLKDMIHLILDTAYVLMNFFTRQRKFVLHSNKIVAVSYAVKDALIEETFIPREKIEVIHNGRDYKFFDELKVEKNNDGVIRLIYVGKIIKSKGVFNLIDIVKNMSAKNIKVSFLGDGEDMDLFERKAASEGLEDVFCFCGKLPHKDVVSSLLMSDIFILPSLRVEGFPMTVIEAMFAGLPVVASDIGGIREAVDDGITGFLVCPGDISLFREKLEILIDDEKLRSEMGWNAKSKALKNFSVDAMLDKYEKVINEVLR